MLPYTPKYAKILYHINKKKKRYGLSFPSKTILEIASALNVSLPELFDFEHLKEDSKFMKKYIISYLENISDENLKIIYRLTKSMK